MESIRKIKVDRSIKPLPLSKRKPFDIVEGGKYYVSFTGKDAVPCTVTEIYMQGSQKRICVEVKNRNIAGIYTLYPDEIGRTPEEAVMNKF